MSLLERRVTGEVDGLSVEVVNHWFKGCGIWVDGRQVAHRGDMIAIDENTPFVEAEVAGHSGPVHLDVRIVAVLFVQIELRANGRYLAGSRLVKEQDG
ncbi:hypothetical protein [Gymnodinialimonas sp.]